MALFSLTSGFRIRVLSSIFLVSLIAKGSFALPLPVPGLSLNTPTTVVLRQGHSITDEAIRQEIDSDTLRLLSFAKPNRILSHLGIRGSLGEVLNRRPQSVGERHDLQSFVFPGNEGSNNQAPPNVFNNDASNVQHHPPPHPLVYPGSDSGNVQPPQKEPNTKDGSQDTAGTQQPPYSPEEGTELPLRTTELPLRTSPDKLLEELMTYGRGNKTAEEEEESYKLGYSVDEGQVKRFRYEEKTPEGLIVGEFGIHKGNGDGIIRGVRYTAEAGVHPKVLYEALVKFLSL